jgi:hypothetical protein
MISPAMIVLLFIFLLFLAGPNTFDVSVIFIHQTCVNFSNLGGDLEVVKENIFFTKLGNLNAKISRLE